MTPEQRAFFEYGKACGVVLAMKRYGKVRFPKASRKQRRAERCCYAPLILDAWRKRAICRSTCAECETYRNELKDSYGTIWCDYIYNYTHGENKCVGCPFFEPRKEGA